RLRSMCTRNCRRWRGCAKLTSPGSLVARRRAARPIDRIGLDGTSQHRRPCVFHDEGVRDLSDRCCSSTSMLLRNVGETVDWLIGGARSAPQPQQVLAQLCERLVAVGIPLWRVAVFVRTLHPNVMGRRFVWRPGAEVETSEAPFELLEMAEFRDNPIARVY